MGRFRGRRGAIQISLSQFVLSLSVPLNAYEGASSETSPINIAVNRSGNIGYGGGCDWAVTGTGANPATTADFGGSFPSGSLTFGAEDVTKDIALTLHGNDDVDGNRTFLVTLSNASTTGGSGVATIGVGAIVCTILDDDVDTPVTQATYNGADVYYGGNPVRYGV